MSTDGQTSDLDRYVDDPRVTQAIQSWARGNGLLATVPELAWRQRGGSGALLVRLRITPLATMQRSVDVLLKVCTAGSPAREPANHRWAWQESPDFAARHLFRQLYPPMIMSDGRVMMFLDSSESLSKAVTLGQLSPAMQLEGCTRAIRLILSDWNTPTAHQHRVMTVQQFLRGELRGVLDRGRSAYNWATGAGLFADPAAAIAARNASHGLIHVAGHIGLYSELTTMVEFLAGKSHGDLHLDNVVVPCTPDGHLNFDHIRLIDLSAFNPMAPLSRDVVALLLSLLLPAVRSGALSTQSPSLAHALTSAAPVVSHPSSLERAALSIRSDVISQIESRLHGLFHRQYLLSLIAHSIIYTSFENVGDSGRRWYFALGAAAAEAFRSSAP
ncbi:hypothetical protein V6W11_27835 [Micromonospora profundi]|uniref:hypothetical protein n=1 Tax=Micromonospora TaxID=1873 RepID=UPI0012F85C6B|nr:hypothetical protein [Micromonospora sp. NRRL B-16802]